MSTNTVKASDFFNPETQVAHLALIACPGAEELAHQIDEHLKAWAREAGVEKDYLWHNHQLSQKKTRGNEQSAELSIFVKLQWKL